MQYEAFSDHITDRIANRQRPTSMPEHILDQADAAMLDGARLVDAASASVRKVGATTTGPLVSSELFAELAARFGDPHTELDVCIHLAERPVQPRHIYGAAPTRAFCRECLTVFLLGVGNEIRRYAASTECDACAQPQ